MDRQRTSGNNVPIDCNIIKIPFESMVSLEVDDVVKEKITAPRKRLQRQHIDIANPGIVRMWAPNFEPREERNSDHGFNSNH